MARVLVVEDDDTVREVVTAHLRRGGHRVIDARSGEDALEVIAERSAPDVAVVDLGLPEMDGFTLADQLRHRPECRDLPVIFLSGRVDEQQIRTGRRKGAAYLTKPFIASALLDAIDRSLPEPVW
jgi:CheY-like chemotaxis protein